VLRGESSVLRNPEFRRLSASGRTLAPVVTLMVVALDPLAAGLAMLRDTAPAVRSFEITASRFKFDPASLEVTEGDEVRLTVRSLDTTHGFEIKAFGVKVKVPKGGEPVSVSFVASRAGTFEIACSEYCGPGHRNMKARLLVATRGA
jgi:cytochrome c oxidase subunit 2